jgi:hypothetical protein
MSCALDIEITVKKSGMQGVRQICYIVSCWLWLPQVLRKAAKCAAKEEAVMLDAEQQLCLEETEEEGKSRLHSAKEAPGRASLDGKLVMVTSYYNLLRKMVCFCG